tara:strand:+ start:63979 stop:64167 length:189 start_codon:yes stop_codon:yes gene_type:complete
MDSHNFSDTIEVPNCGTYQLIKIENQGVPTRETAIYERIEWDALAPWIVKIRTKQKQDCRTF